MAVTTGSGSGGQVGLAAGECDDVAVATLEQAIDDSGSDDPTGPGDNHGA